MTGAQLAERLRVWCGQVVPAPGGGRTAERHARLIEVGREDLSLAKLVEAHWDAEAILLEAGRTPAAGCVYGVWASEGTGAGLTLEPEGSGYVLSGMKRFASGGRLLDRVLVTTGGPEPLLVELDLKANAARVGFDLEVWKTEAFRLTETGAVSFDRCRVHADAVVGEPGWYLKRPGFWHGACGPAACWAGGALGLVQFAQGSTRRDPHTLAHLGAMEAAIWGMRAVLDAAGREIDEAPLDGPGAHRRALTVRHLIEQAGTEVLTRFARAYGPVPLAMEEDVARRWAELHLFLRQSHGERDLEQLGRTVCQESLERQR